MTDPYRKENEKIIFTRHEDGSITASHFPEETDISADMLVMESTPEFEIYATVTLRLANGTAIYRLVGPGKSYGTGRLRKVWDGRE